MRRKSWTGLLALLVCFGLGGCTPPKPDTRVPITASSQGALKQYLKAREALESYRMEEAREHFMAALAKDPDLAMARLGMAKLAETEEEFLDWLRGAVRLTRDVSEGERQLILAVDATAQGDSDAAFGHARQLANRYPEDARAQLFLGDTYMDFGNHAHAVTCYRKALELEPGLASAHQGLAAAYIVAGRLPQAEEVLTRHAELLPDVAISHRLLGDALMKDGRYADALTAYEKAVSIDPEDDLAHVGAGCCLLFQDRIDDALARFRRMQEEGASAELRRTGLVWSAAVHLHQGAYDDALALLDSAYALAEGDPRARARLKKLMGNVLLEAGALEPATTRFAEAVSVYQQSDLPGMEKMAARVDHLYDRARVELARGDLDQARQTLVEYRKSLSTRATPEAKYRFSELGARLALAEGKYANALKHLGRANERDPRILFLMARAHEAAGDGERARALYESVAGFNEARIELAFVRPKARRKLAEL